jgi:adenylate cyclase
LAFVNSIEATAIFELEKLMGSQSLGTYSEFLEDRDQNLQLDEILKRNYDSKFFVSKLDTPNFGVSDSIYWVRFQLNNNSILALDRELFLEIKQPQFV